MQSNRIDKKQRAKKRVEELKGFYIHSIVYVLVNLFILISTVIARTRGGEGLSDALFNFGTLATPFFWGIGLTFHAAKVFSFNPFFNKEWEERQIEKYMEEDKKNAHKYSTRTKDN
ncbi:2TM domain-containing protein [Pareuzebyella sediminis]|uniref:2TM domain-containing protein n=1 Tax=Pareuzebyella sediminis TaxID=2607998 RepID=UPI0011ED56B0|nr:2TM domain-containing protein [Pareuzebyella sediminis]